MNLAMAIVITIVAMGILIVDVQYCNRLKQEVDQLWSLCRQFADFTHGYDEELKSLASRMKILEDETK